MGQNVTERSCFGPSVAWIAAARTVGGRDAVIADVMEIAGRVPAWRGRALEVEALAGGITNRNFVVRVDGGARYVVRFPGERTELLGIDRAVSARPRGEPPHSASDRRSSASCRASARRSPSWCPGTISTAATSGSVSARSSTWCAASTTAGRSGTPSRSIASWRPTPATPLATASIHRRRTGSWPSRRRASRLRSRRRRHRRFRATTTCCRRTCCSALGRCGCSTSSTRA